MAYPQLPAQAYGAQRPNFGQIPPMPGQIPGQMPPQMMPPQMQTQVLPQMPSQAFGPNGMPAGAMPNGLPPQAMGGMGGNPGYGPSNMPPNAQNGAHGASMGFPGQANGGVFPGQGGPVAGGFPGGMNGIRPQMPSMGQAPTGQVPPMQGQASQFPGAADMRPQMPQNFTMPIQAQGIQGAGSMPQGFANRPGGLLGQFGQFS